MHQDYAQKFERYQRGGILGTHRRGKLRTDWFGQRRDFHIQTYIATKIDLSVSCRLLELNLIFANKKIAVLIMIWQYFWWLETIVI